MELTVRLKVLLTEFGFSCEQPNDAAILKWALKEAENYAISELDLPKITEELEAPLLNIAAGEYLKAKKAVSGGETTVFNPAPAIKRLELGDTKTEFDTGNYVAPEQRLDIFIEYLIKSGKSILNRYRRLKW